MAFVGAADYQLDDRNRVPVPPGYRSAFKDGGYIQASTDTCLILHTNESFAQAAERIEALPEETDEGEEARRDFYGSTWPVAPDGQGRVLLTKEMIEHARLGKEVKVVGVGRRLEVWDRALWEAREEQRKAVRKAALNGQLGATARGSVEG
jgi:MraZ protein